MSLDSTFLLRSDGRNPYGGRYGGDMADCGETGKKRACRPFGPLYPRTYEARRADLRSRCEKKGKTFEEEEERHQAKRKKKNKKSLCTDSPGRL